MTLELSEKEYLAQILEAAQTLGWITYHTYSSERSTHGFPDLVLVRPPRVLFVELKSAKGSLSRAQAIWAMDLRECPGVEHYVWRPGDWESVTDVLRN